MNGKVLAVVVAMIMMMVGCTIMSDNDSDAVGETVVSNEIPNLVKVYFMESADSDADPTLDGNQADSQSVYGYDLYQALTKVQKTETETNLNIKITSSNPVWNQQIGTGAYAYYNPDENYGKLSTLTIGTSTAESLSDYDIWVYNKKAASVNGFEDVNYGWHQAIDAIGWYHPFDDYSAYSIDSNNTFHSLSSASIAILPKNVDPSDVVCPSPNIPFNVPSLNGIANSTSISDVDSRFVYEFTLKSQKPLRTFSSVSVVQATSTTFNTATITPQILKNGGMTIVGAGSNAFEALKDALGLSNVIGQDEFVKFVGEGANMHPEYYSWMKTILGSGTKTITNTSSTAYYYWSSFVGTEYCSYTLGYYSQLSGSQNPGSIFTLDYQYEEYPNSA